MKHHYEPVYDYRDPRCDGYVDPDAYDDALIARAEAKHEEYGEELD